MNYLSASRSFITYAHKDEPNGVRYTALKKDTVPVWAVDVQDYVEPKYLTPEEKFAEKVAEFRNALKSEGLNFTEEMDDLLQAVYVFCDSARYTGYQDGRSDGYNEGFDAGDQG